MGVKRVIDTSFWNDDKVIELFSPEDKLFMLYIITNPHTTQLGIYHINKKNMAFELGYSLDTISVLLDRFENKYEIIKYSNDTNEIAIKNYLKHSIIKGGKPVEDLLKKEINQVKDKSLLKYIFNNIKDYDNLNLTVNNIINLLNINDNNDNDNEVSLHESTNESLDNKVKLIIDYLNDKAKTNFRYNTDATKKLIKGRIKKGYKFDDFVNVIDKKCEEWLGTDMEMYLRPSTLFCETHFEEYLNGKEKKNNKPKWFDKKVEKTDVSEEEEQKLNQMMEKYK